MPGPPAPTVIQSEQGAIVAVVHLDHTVDVYQIPPSGTITIQPQTGFGNVVKTSSSVSKADAETDIDTQLGHDGAV